MALMRRQSLVKFDAPLCETVVDKQKWIEALRAGKVVGRIMLAN
jgi:hypothetical protein